MKMKKCVCLMLSLILVLGLFSGCGAQSSAADQTPAAEAGMMMANGAPKVSEDAALPQGRKWVVTIRLTAETDDLDQTLASLENSLAQAQGYVEDQRLDNGRTQDSRRYRSAYLTLRVPVEQADGFVCQVEEVSHVVYQEKSREDVTLRYVSTENQLAALEAEEARLLQLLSQAETMADLLEIEARLSEVRYELENIASQKRLLDNKIDYATIDLSLEEVTQYTPVQPTFWQRVSQGFLASLKGLGTLFQNLGVFLLAGSPYLLLLGGLTAAIVIPLRKHRKKKKQEK